MCIETRSSPRFDTERDRGGGGGGGESSTLPEIRRNRRMQSNTILRDVVSTEKMMGNNNNLNNNGSPGTDIMFQMEDDSLTQLGSVFQSAYQSIVGGSAQVREN